MSYSSIWIDHDFAAALPACSIPSLHSSSGTPMPTTFRLRYSISLSEGTAVSDPSAFRDMVCLKIAPNVSLINLNTVDAAFYG